MIASKIVTGQNGSSTVLKQVNVQSDQQCKFLGIHTVWDIGALTVGGVVPKLGSVRGCKVSLQCKRQFVMEEGICGRRTMHSTTTTYHGCRRRSVPQLSPLRVRVLGIRYPCLFVKCAVSRHSGAI